MTLDVTVLRVFTDAAGEYGNPLGVVESSLVAAADRQRVAAELGYSETIFVDRPTPGTSTAAARIFTPVTELPFAGHPVVGASWWLRDRGMPIRTLRVPAGVVQVRYDERPDGDFTEISAPPDWAPEFALYDLGSVEDVLNADPDDYGSDVEHYVWAWIDEAQGTIRSRLFAEHLGIVEDEATGAAAIRITAQLRRDVTITQGRGSRLHTTWTAEGWVTVAGRVVDDGIRQLD